MGTRSIKPLIQIDPKQLAELPPERRQAVEEALHKLNEPPACEKAEMYDYKMAWKTILENVKPNVNLPLFSKDVWPNLSDGSFYEGPLSFFFYPEFLEGAGICFSSVSFNYLRKDYPFRSLPSQNKTNFTKGWEYLPLIRAMVKAGGCADPETATRVLEDLLYIGGPKSDEIMDMVAQNIPRYTVEFSRVYLNLISFYGLPQEDQSQRSQRLEGFYKALIAILPDQPKKLDREDRDLFMESLKIVKVYLTESEKDEIVDRIISERPQYKEMMSGKGLSDHGKKDWRKR